MAARLRRLSFLRSRSDVQIGVGGAFLVVLAFAVAATAVYAHTVRDVPDQLLGALVGVGSAVFIAYSVGVSGLFRQIRRGSDIEFLLGFMTGLSICGVFGVGFALWLLAASKPLGPLGDFGFCWASISIGFLAGVVAALPLFAYEDARVKHLNRDD
jgi:hypothetical protein